LFSFNFGFACKVFAGFQTSILSRGQIRDEMKTNIK
jgi:hypothetical protein